MANGFTFAGINLLGVGKYVSDGYAQGNAVTLYFHQIVLLETDG